MTSLRNADILETGTPERGRRAGPWPFAILYIGWAYLWWSPILAAETSVWSGANLVLFLVGGASPLLAGVLLAWLTGGMEYIIDLDRRLVDPRRVPGRWWLFIVVFWPAFNLVMAGAAILLGVSRQPLTSPLTSWPILARWCSS